MLPERITSTKNPKIKDLLVLQEKSRERRERSLFVVEGRRELGHCLDAGYRCAALFLCPGLLPAEDRDRLVRKALAGSPDCRMYEVSEEVYAKIAWREGTEGIVAQIHDPGRTLEDLVLPERPLVMVLQGVEKPGNIGAILRSADAAGVDALLCCDPLADLYNPNLIRASIGAVFTCQTAVTSSQEAIRWLKARNIRILTAQLQDSVPYYATDMTGPTALVMGTEATGLTREWREAADEHILIPMLGKLDSLNVSVSAAILLYEAVRQRHA